MNGMRRKCYVNQLVRTLTEHNIYIANGFLFLMTNCTVHDDALLTWRNVYLDSRRGNIWRRTIGGGFRLKNCIRLEDVSEFFFRIFTFHSKKIT